MTLQALGYATSVRTGGTPIEARTRSAGYRAILVLAALAAGAPVTAGGGCGVTSFDL